MWYIPITIMLAPGFISGGDYPGYTEKRYFDKDTLEQDFLEKSEFMFSHHVPLWVGEFGPVYTGILKKMKCDTRYLKISWHITTNTR